MAVDQDLNQRFRDALADAEGISEKRMMGGICFFLNGNMIGGADRTKDGQRRFMFRVGKENERAALSLPGAILMEQGGRRMGGMFFVEETACTEAVLQQWLSLATGFASTLPPR